MKSRYRTWLAVPPEETEAVKNAVPPLNGRKAVALRLFGRVELLEALVAGDNKEVILPGKQAFQLIPVFQHILGIVHQIPPSYFLVVLCYGS